MKKVSLALLVLIISVICLACPGIGKYDREAAENVITTIKEEHPDEVIEISVFRDKMQIAFKKDIHVTKKASIFMKSASVWWMSYPKEHKPRHKLYCWAYDEVISDDDIGSLTLQRGSSDAPRIIGEPGIYSMRDVK